MPVKDIARVAMPDRDEFLRRYVFAAQPVVITNLFEGQEVSAIRTVDGALAAWGGMTIQVQEEYTAVEGTAPSQPTFTTFRDYVEFARRTPSTRLCCTEYETPARILSSFRLPVVCRITSPDEQEIFGLPKKYGDFDLVGAVFIANAGNVGHLHFDGDQREVFLHQVYGRKRVVLFPPVSAIHLKTLDGPYSRPSLSGVYLERMNLEDKLSLVESAGGWHTVLEPGETIYIPRLMWHHLEYIDDAMSFNIRFGRNRFGRFLSLDNFHRDPYIQNVAAKLAGPGDVLDGFNPIVDEIKTEYTKVVPDMTHKVRDMRVLFRALCARIAPEAAPDDLCPTDREDDQVTRIVQSRDMKGGLKYATPETIASTRPVGPIAPRQREIIRDAVTRCGYSPEVMRSVLFNRVGKSELDDLSRAEAAQVASYLATPGAVW